MCVYYYHHHTQEDFVMEVLHHSCTISIISGIIIIVIGYWEYDSFNVGEEELQKIVGAFGKLLTKSIMIEKGIKHPPLPVGCKMFTTKLY